MNRKGGMTDIFIFMVFAFVIILISVIFIYLGGRVNSTVHQALDGKMFGERNATEVIDNSLGKVSHAYQNLYWISVFLIVGMVVAIFIGSYMVTTKPIFFFPYIFVMIIAVVVSVVMSNAYETVKATPTLASTFEGFVGANFIMAYLPIWVTVIGFVGAIIMFSRMGTQSSQYVYSGGMQ